MLSDAGIEAPFFLVSVRVAPSCKLEARALARALLLLQDQAPFALDAMITGVHAIIYSKQAEAVRAFFRDTLGRPHVDANRGWLIFALPPAELGIHPSGEDESHELYLMC